MANPAPGEPSRLPTGTRAPSKLMTAWPPWARSV